ncbi:MAG: hypothetical protein QNJ72_07675 [Pleurocapsa sp. MO_226.B13]|nr:hypothetical protein [Pleurocapsa sp. MO_226.B13]
MRIYTIIKEGKSGELHITHGYRNPEGEIYLAEDEVCRIIERENDIPTAITEKLSSQSLEIDLNKDIQLEVFKTKNHDLERIYIYIKGSLYKTIKSNNPGDTFNVDIDNGSEVNTETWTILSMEEIKEKVAPNQEYSEEI